MLRSSVAAIVLLAARVARADDAEEMTDEDWLRLAEEQGEVITVWDERPEKPFDRDTELRLTGEELARRGATDLATALALLPDVMVRDVGRGGFNVDIRGARKGAVRVLIDGVAVSDPFYGTFDVSTIPITDIEEIRVSTSPASPIDGPGGPGGVIEVHTRDAVGPRLVVGRLSGDTLPTFTAAATGRVQHSEHVAFRLSASSTFGLASYEIPDGEVEDERRTTTGAMRVEYREGQRRAVIDGFVDDRQYVSPPSDELATALILLIDRETTARVGVGFDDAVGVGERLQLQARAWLHAMHRASRNFRDPELDDEVNAEDLAATRAGAMGLLTRPIGARARWVASLTIDHERADVGSSVDGQDARGDATIVEAAAGGQLELGAMNVAADAGLAVPFGVDASPWPEGKLTASYTRRGVTAELVAARKGRVPSLRERFQGMNANTALDPEQAWHGELRVTTRVRDGVELVVAPYVRRTTGTLKLDESFMLVNLGELDVRGVDLIGRARLIDQLTIGGAYSYTTAYSADLPPPQDEEPIDRLPHHRAEGWLEARPIDPLAIRVRYRHAGRSYDRGDEVAAYGLLDLTVTADLDGGWMGALRCDDLLDVAPETRADHRQPGRVFSLTVERSWD